MPTYLARDRREYRRLGEFMAAVGGLFYNPRRGLNPTETEEPYLLAETQEGGQQLSPVSKP